MPQERVRASQRDKQGRRGETLTESALTKPFALPGEEPDIHFGVAFLGEKWAGVDYLIEILTTDSALRPYFFVQVRAVTQTLKPGTKRLSIGADLGLILPYPAPTYLIGVHLPTEKLYLASANETRRIKSGIPMIYDLSQDSVLIDLYNEVYDFWRVKKIIPPKLNSKFADRKQNRNGKQ
jgi:hypothetical protein